VITLIVNLVCGVQFFNITYLLLLKYRFPEKIVLLKENHECNYIILCFPYEFKAEIIKRFGSSKLHDKYVEFFSAMSLMVLTNNIFAAHGGIVKGADLKYLRKVGKNDKIAIEALIWCDPVLFLTFIEADFIFYNNNLSEFLKYIDAKFFVRGDKYSILHYLIYKDKCLNIFSFSMYKGMGNGGILVAKADKKK